MKDQIERRDAVEEGGPFQPCLAGSAHDTLVVLPLLICSQ
jgi:hypothetical protein